MHNKDLVPNKILTTISDKFSSYDELVNNINWDKVKHTPIKNVLYSLIDSIDEFDIAESTGFFRNADFNDAVADKESPLNGKLVI